LAPGLYRFLMRVPDHDLPIGVPRSSACRYPRSAMSLLFLRSAVLATLLPLQQGSSETRTYLPPGEPGYIYVVVAHPAANGTDTTVGVRWGGWRQTGRFTPSSAGLGVVLRLRHAKWDRVPLTITTSGRIVSGPSQGGAPGEWGDTRFERAIW
jgi:hypothetical protein